MAPSGRIGYIIPAVFGGPQRLKTVDNIKSVPQVGGLVTTAVEGVPHASVQGTKSQVAYKWAD